MSALQLHQVQTAFSPFLPPPGGNLAWVFEVKLLPPSGGIWLVSQLCGGPVVVLRGSSGSGFTFSASLTAENMHHQHPPWEPAASALVVSARSDLHVCLTSGWEIWGHVRALYFLVGFFFLFYCKSSLTPLPFRQMPLTFVSSAHVKSGRKVRRPSKAYQLIYPLRKWKLDKVECWNLLSKLVFFH